MSTLASVRRSIFPQEQDTWVSIAAREFPDQEQDTIVSQLQSWNMHVFMRPTGSGSQILPSDVIFLEAPLAQ